MAQATGVPLLSREGYLELLAVGVANADEAKIGMLFDKKLDEVRRSGGMFEICAESQPRAAYVRASVELGKHPGLYQTSDTKTNETPKSH